MHELSGRPDLVIEDPDGKLIVVENKTRGVGNYPNDRAQLATYFILCEEYYGRRIDHGWLVFRSRKFKIENTEDLRERVLKTRKSIQRKIERDEPGEETDNPNKCPGCPEVVKCKGEAEAARLRAAEPQTDRSRRS